jgi:tetratricopeptide (TPR) repeat protein
MSMDLTDYEREVASLEQRLSAVGASATDSLAFQTAMHAGNLYNYASLTGNLTMLRDAETEADRAIELTSQAGDLHLLKAKIALKLHRLLDVERDLGSAPELAGTASALGLLSDVALQRGQYADARRIADIVVERDRSWDALARAAHLASLFDAPQVADALFDEAQDELTAKEMRSFAWLELQRGALDAKAGRYSEAESHYDRADRAYSGYWLVDEYRASLAALAGRITEAIREYESLVARVAKPELCQKLGELYLAIGRRADGDAMLAKAHSVFLASAEREEVHYYHHLVQLYSGAMPNARDALYWARRDCDLRRNHATLSALAWALYQNGLLSEARSAMDEALASGVRSNELQRRAAVIFASSSTEAAPRARESATPSPFTS